MWNGRLETLFDKVEALIKENVCMKLYDEARPLYVETDASGVGAGLLQIRDGVSCP